MTGLLVVACILGCLFLARKPLTRRRNERRRVTAIGDAVPEVIEMVAVVVGSGGTVHEALRVLRAAGPLSIKPSLEALESRMRAGQPLAAALLRWGDDLGATHRPLISALLAAERDGAPLSDLLGRLADEAVAARRFRTEARARSLPVQLLFPVVFCALPAVLVGAVVPLVFVSVDRL